MEPIYILDAKTLAVYESGNAAHPARTADPSGDVVKAGGFGGNAKTGKYTYDGLAGNKAGFDILRNASTNTCYLQNDFLRIKIKGKNRVFDFACGTPDAEHGNIYWTGELERVNDGYSTDNDAMYNVARTFDVFKSWYGLNVYDDNGKPKRLSVLLHYKFSGGIFANGVLSLGDTVAASVYHPFTTLQAVSHEIGHGFTDQHANFTYSGQPAAIDESFSDMVAMATDYFDSGKLSWGYGSDVMVKPNKAIRYLDKPSKECAPGKEPGDQCGIDNASQYKDGMMRHFAAGVYNRMFYTLSNAPCWDIRKAFDVMVGANMDYWTSKSDWKDAACGVLGSAKDIGYDTKEIVNAFNVVGIDTSHC